MAKRARNSRASTSRPGDAARADRPEAAPPEADLREDTRAAEAADQVAESGQAGDEEEIAGAVQDHVGGPQTSPTRAERQAHGEDVAAIAGVLLEGLRQVIVRRGDFPAPPYMRVVGRVIHVLTLARGWPSCTGPEVFRVLLEEIPEQLPPDQRQTPRFGRQVDATKPTGLRTVYKRLERLVDDRYAATTAQMTNERDGQYVMTDIGRLVFDGWPTHVRLSLEPRPRERARARTTQRNTGGPRPSQPATPTRPPEASGP